MGTYIYSCLLKPRCRTRFHMAVFNVETQKLITTRLPPTSFYRPKMQQNRWRPGAPPRTPLEAHDAPQTPSRMGRACSLIPRLHPSTSTAPAVYINDQMLFTLLSHQSCFAVETLVTVYCLKTIRKKLKKWGGRGKLEVEPK